MNVNCRPYLLFKLRFTIKLALCLNLQCGKNRRKKAYTKSVRYCAAARDTDKDTKFAEKNKNTRFFLLEMLNESTKICVRKRLQPLLKDPVH